MYIAAENSFYQFSKHDYNIFSYAELIIDFMRFVCKRRRSVALTSQLTFTIINSSSNTERLLAAQSTLRANCVCVNNVKSVVHLSTDEADEKVGYRLVQSRAAPPDLTRENSP